MFYFAVSNNKKAKILKKKIFRNYKNTNLKKAKAIIVCGGDGFMLHSIKKYLKYKKPFYGVNCGNVGFLMNNYISSKFEKTAPSSFNSFSISSFEYSGPK